MLNFSNLFIGVDVSATFCEIIEATLASEIFIVVCWFTNAPYDKTESVSAIYCVVPPSLCHS
jgi:hypothetical protein